MLRRFSILCRAILLLPLLLASVALAEPVDITADEISRTADGVVLARGHVVIKRQWDTLTADEVTYRSREHVLEARGHVVISSDKATIASDEAIMQTQSNTGFINNAVITLPGGERLTAVRVKRIDDQTYEAEEVIFSSCPIDDESWRVAARRAILDQHDGSLTTYDARLELWRVPVLYMPWWQQPLRRKSGLLMPTLATGKRRGTEISMPYYIAPQANWDATVTPHWMSARGVMGELELRHASSLGTELINLAAIDDTLTGAMRSRLAGEMHWQLPANMQFKAMADHISDHLYVADYGAGGGNGDQISATYLQSTASLSQTGRYQDFSGNWALQAVHYQSLQLPSNATTLQILPRLQSQTQWALAPHSILHLDQQSTRFNRQSGVDGWRVNVHPYIEMPWQLDGGGISAVLSAGVQHTRYWLQQTALANTTPRRTTAEASLEVRMDMERIAGDAKRQWRHVISPILRYDYVDAPNQSALPNFDSSLAVLTWSNLLSGNRFSGLDRIEKTNRLSVLLENRLQVKDTNSDVNINSTVRDVLIVRGGASYDVQQQRVDPALQAPTTRLLSNLLGEVIWQPTANMRLYSSGQYDPGNQYWANITASAQLRSEAGHQLQVGYQFTDARYAVAAQVLDVAASIGLSRRWQAQASWQYDILRKFSQRTSLGLQYNHPCWALGFDAYKTNSPVGTGAASNYGFHLLLEFKGLGSVGS